MTTDTARTRELDIARISLRAYQLAAERNVAQGISEAEGSYARDTIGMIIDEMQAHGLRARAVDFRNVTLVSGTSAYTMDSDVLDVVGDAMWIDPDETDVDAAAGEIPIVMIGRDEWQLLSDKSATGRPTLYYVHRTASPPEVRFWPTPDADTDGTVRFQIHILAANSNDSSKTLDLERVYAKYITWELAHHISLASSRFNQARYYGEQSRMMLEQCKSFAGQRSPAQFVVRHRTGWHK